MNPPAVSYRKLPGAAWSASGRSRLWLADDHLLEANALLIVERYHRFFLRDIRALLVQQTKVGRVLNIVSGILTSVSVIVTAGFSFAAASATATDSRIAFWIFAGFFGVAALGALTFWVVNLLLGPTCRCVIHTTAGAHPLEAPKRLRHARHLLAELAPQVEAAQGGAPALAATPP